MSRRNPNPHQNRRAEKAAQRQLDRDRARHERKAQRQLIGPMAKTAIERPCWALPPGAEGCAPPSPPPPPERRTHRRTSDWADRLHDSRRIT